MVEKLAIKPYVRLLKMLGEDLIKDSKTALIELVKNAYDADATWVTVNFKNFGDNFSVTAKSEIIIEDNGDGMTDDILRNEWLNPGTPFKKNMKKNNHVTEKGRILQGEKGIGRFSMFKLGRIIELSTKHQESLNEHKIVVDLSNYDDDFMSSSASSEAEFLEDMEVTLSQNSVSTFDEPGYFERKGTGTRITISNLNGSWNAKKIKEVYSDVAALQSIGPIINGWTTDSKLEDFSTGAREFAVHFYRDGVETYHKKEYEANLEQLLNIIKEKCFLEVKQGKFNDQDKEFSFTINNASKTIKITDPLMKNLNVYKRYFVDERDSFEEDTIECGPFSFEFYIFLLDPRAYNKIETEKYRVNTEEREILKKHRIYLYRDDIRVYPYGDPKDDWLQTDTLRGILQAGQFFSNDQVVGIINITHSGNLNLQDKTNREGLIANGEAVSEIIALLQTFLSYLRTHQYNDFLLELENAKKQAERKKAEEARKKREEERQKQEEQRKKDEEERLLREEEQRKKAEQDKQEAARTKQNREDEQQEGQDQNPNGSNKENESDPGNKSIEEIETAIDMKNKRKNLFFKRSDILKSSIQGSTFYLEHNELIEQLSSLKYEKHYLLFVMSFRVLIENAAKKYLVSFAQKDLRAGLGENVNLMIEDILARTSQLEAPKQSIIYGMFGGRDSFRNQLKVIKDEFYKNGSQELLATRLNALTHNPIRMEELDALNIANNKILPLILVSEKLMEL
ncbi:ATP-binding protein [Paenibacillus sp. SN-8-1]|uniref:ATP-binding protein n=1 Tax=Paenibacillus sp. SN-8-1 TaxID=3435409 RepID=UPI003D9A99F7